MIYFMHALFSLIYRICLLCTYYSRFERSIVSKFSAEMSNVTHNIHDFFGHTRWTLQMTGKQPVQVRKLVNPSIRNCSASHMFVSRGLPTCKMLIRKSIYGFMISTKRSCNTILQNIVGSDRIYTSPLLQHWRLLLYAHAF